MCCNVVGRPFLPTLPIPYVEVYHVHIWDHLSIFSASSFVHLKQWLSLILQTYLYANINLRTSVHSVSMNIGLTVIAGTAIHIIRRIYKINIPESTVWAFLKMWDFFCIQNMIRIFPKMQSIFPGHTHMKMS